MSEASLSAGRQARGQVEINPGRGAEPDLTTVKGELFKRPRDAVIASKIPGRNLFY